jgi:hypothetical protein
MNNFTNLVHKNHHILLKDFCCISEISDITETKDTHDLTSRKNRINATSRLDVFGNNLRTGLAIADSKKGSNFDDSFFKDFSLKYLVFSSLKEPLEELLWFLLLLYLLKCNSFILLFFGST